MKRFWMIVALVAFVAAFGAVSVVSAQGETPPVPGVPGQGYGRMGQGRMAAQYGAGWMHEYMAPAVAEQLDLTVEELEALHAEGQTFWQIAEARGYTLEEAQALLADARAVALDAAVAAGTITQEQADWMNTRMGSGRMMGQGGCPGMGGGWNNGSSTGAPRGRMGGRW